MSLFKLAYDKRQIDDNNFYIMFCVEKCPNWVSLQASRWNGFDSGSCCACLLIWEPVRASVRLVQPRTWFKPPVAICFATDRSKAVTPRVLTFVNCLWRLFWNWLLYNHAVFSSLFFGCVGRLCLLDVAIPDMHISLFYVGCELRNISRTSILKSNKTRMVLN
jgi:hypothetical protein